MADESLQPDSPSPSTQGSSCKLFLGGLSWETNEEKLKNHFEKYGDIVEVVVMRDRNTSKPRGFGFITFKEPNVAERVCQEEHVIDNRTIDAKPSVPQSEGQKPRSKKIFVGGLAPDTTEEQFKAYFEDFGKIAEAQIMQDHTSGRSRGFGFVTYEEESAVDKVFTAGSMHELNGKKVEVKNATPKGSGPQGVRGRGTFLTGRSLLPGRPYQEFGVPGFGVPGSPFPGFGMMPPYYNSMPHYPYSGMVMSNMGSYPTNYGFGAYGPYPTQGQSMPQHYTQQDNNRFHPYASGRTTRGSSSQRP